MDAQALGYVASTTGLSDLCLVSRIQSTGYQMGYVIDHIGANPVMKVMPEHDVSSSNVVGSNAGGSEGFSREICFYDHLRVKYVHNTSISCILYKCFRLHVR